MTTMLTRLLLLLLCYSLVPCHAQSVDPLLQTFFQDLTSRLPIYWEKEPHLWQLSSSPTLFSFDDAVAGAQGGLLDDYRANVAKTQDAIQGKWVSENIASPVRTRDDLRQVLERGTVFINGAGLDYPKLASLAQLAQDQLGLPVNLNVYITKPGREVSVSPHTDAQNVLVIQTQGRKRWRVWAPPARVPGKDPFGRGKRGDKIDMSELGAPLIDTWMEPGSVLYVPIGFPHATSTTEATSSTTAGDGDKDISCHVTLGIDTYFYGLCYCTLRALALAKAKSQETVDMFQLDESLHKRLFSPLPFGFLGASCPNDNDDTQTAFVKTVTAELRSLNDQAAAFLGIEAPSLGDDQTIEACVRFLLEHYRRIMDPDKYADVTNPAEQSDSVEALLARTQRNQKNQREEAAQKQLGTWAAS